MYSFTYVISRKQPVFAFWKSPYFAFFPQV